MDSYSSNNEKTISAIHDQLIRSPFIASFIGQARTCALDDSDPKRRQAAWANGCVNSLIEVSTGERSYAALRVPGSFYDPQSKGPRVIPHMEIPRKNLGSPDDEFPARLAQMGNGLQFPYWLYSEITALRRALFNTLNGPIGELVGVLDSRRPDLVNGLILMTQQCEPQWDTIASLILDSDDGLSSDITSPFTTEEIANYFPPALDFSLEVHYDSGLKDKNGPWISRRIGVWQITGETPGGDKFSLGVVTPRLTINSLFVDKLFNPESEASAALLVRAVLLRRLVLRHLDAPLPFQIGAPNPPTPSSFLRAIPAKLGAKLPEASSASTINFLQAYPEPDAAWQALLAWSNHGYVLTVTEEGFIAAHRRSSRALRRIENLERSDIDCVLPLAWDTRDGKSQVVRVTFSQLKSPAQ